jgi:hypothetical protein
MNKNIIPLNIWKLYDIIELKRKSMLKSKQITVILHIKIFVIKAIMIRKCVTLK